jgi:hypothetical protein
MAFTSQIKLTLFPSQVVWLNWGLTDEDMKTMPAGVQRGFMKDTIEAVSTGIRSYTELGSDLGDSKGRCLFAGSWLVVALKSLSK